MDRSRLLPRQIKRTFPSCTLWSPREEQVAADELPVFTPLDLLLFLRRSQCRFSRLGVRLQYFIVFNKCWPEFTVLTNLITLTKYPGQRWGYSLNWLGISLNKFPEILCDHWVECKVWITLFWESNYTNKVFGNSNRILSMLQHLVYQIRITCWDVVNRNICIFCCESNSSISCHF